MCDYSLELYRKVDAEVGQKYTLARFPSGTMGLAAPGTDDCAACLKDGSKILISGLSSSTQKTFEIGEAEEAVFGKSEIVGGHRDGVRFSNDKFALLQSLGGDISVTLLSLPEEKLEQAPPAEAAPDLIDAD